jgi:3'-phosphoadenosine 5'-phosphosulfate sulfotransferase (PAPS reductase)/FAD synthetase
MKLLTGVGVELAEITHPSEPTIDALIGARALFVVNHSGGKDSQAMMVKILERVPASQVVVIHASLGEIEWQGALEHAQAQAAAAAVPFIVARATKTFFDMVEHRFATRPDAPSFPSAAYRQCTSDLKRGPLEREIRRYAKEHGHLCIVSCTGIRAQESFARAKQVPFKRNEGQSIAGRQWFSWCPIFQLSTADVFVTIKAAGQEPHWAYAAGNERLSCVFCIMGSKRDLKNGAKHNPKLAATYIALEKKTGYTMHQSRKPLAELIGDAALDGLEGAGAETPISCAAAA